MPGIQHHMQPLRQGTREYADSAKSTRATERISDTASQRWTTQELSTMCLTNPQENGSEHVPNLNRISDCRWQHHPSDRLSAAWQEARNHQRLNHNIGARRFSGKWFTSPTNCREDLGIIPDNFPTMGKGDPINAVTTSHQEDSHKRSRQCCHHLTPRGMSMPTKPPPCPATLSHWGQQRVAPTIPPGRSSTFNGTPWWMVHLCDY